MGTCLVVQPRTPIDSHSGGLESGYLARPEDLIKLCPGKTLDEDNPLRSVAMCRMN